MTSLSGLNDGDFTNIDVVYTISINGDQGSNNQVLNSNGDTTEYKTITGSMINLEDLTATGGTILIGGSDTGVYDGSVARSIAVAKVPNALTAGTNISFNTGTTYDGSTAITINSTDTDNQLVLSEGSGIVITDLGGFNRRIATNIDADTIVFDGSNKMEVAKVPNVLTAGTNVSFTNTSDGAVETTYDGSTGITITATDTDTQLNLTEGNGITITNTGGVNRTIAVNADGTTLNNNVGSGQAGVIKVPNDLTAGHNITFTSGTTYNGGTARTITSSPYFFHDAYDPSSLDSDLLSTSYNNIFSSNLFNSFTAEETECAIELRVYNAQTSSFGRSTFARLNGSSSTSSTAEFTTFYSTGGRDTTRTIHQADESDDVYLTMTWVLTGLTVGNTYNLYPQMRSTSSSSNFIRAGGSNAPAILRGYYLPPSGF